MDDYRHSHSDRDRYYSHRHDYPAGGDLHCHPNKPGDPVPYYDRSPDGDEHADAKPDADTNTAAVLDRFRYADATGNNYP